MPSISRFFSSLFATPPPSTPFLVLRELDSAREAITAALAEAVRLVQLAQQQPER